jgi:ribulose 1,5-bisphosphate synthetase/thiazole synthase
MGANSTSKTGDLHYEEAGNVLEVPVLIVGGGPSGLLLAYLLSKLGGLCTAYLQPCI